MSRAFHAMHLDYASQLRLAMEEGASPEAVQALLDAINARWEDFFEAVGPELVHDWAERAAQGSLDVTDASIRGFARNITLPTPKFSDDAIKRMGAAVEGNIGYINSMVGDYHDAMHGVVMRAFTDPEGGAHKIFQEALKHYPDNPKFNVRKRAALTARLETAKVTALIERERCTDLGIEEFRWNHSGGSAEPRPDHVAMDGKIYRYDDPPVIDERTGQRGLPGTIWNCKCFGTPIMPFNRDAKRIDADEMLDERVATWQLAASEEAPYMREYKRKIDIVPPRRTKEIPPHLQELAAWILQTA